MGSSHDRGKQAQRLVLGSVPFNLFINYLKLRVSSALARFTDSKNQADCEALQEISINWVCGQQRCH